MSNVSIQSSVSSEQRGYGRGLILGLTMAESMLLLVFCLLLAAGAIIVKEREKFEEAEAEKKVVEIKLKAEQAKVVKLTEERNQLVKLAVNKKTSEEVWRKLILAQTQMEEITNLGLTPEEIIKNAQMVREAINGQMTADDVRVADSVTKMLQKNDVTAEEVIAMEPVVATLKKTELTPKDIEELAVAIKLLKDKVVTASAETQPEEQLLELIKQAERAKTARNSEPHEWPPIINLSETKDYFFTSGSAELSPGFKKLLTENTSAQIAGIAKKYNVDVIEVIGHTDEQKINGVRSNLDVEIKGVLNGTTSVGVLRPGDNAGLGLARAMAVAEVLKQMPELKGLRVLPMSGAQLIRPDDSLTDGVASKEDKARRRIEIRVRKRNVSEEDTTPDLSNEKIVGGIFKR